ncbi:hypothetical protein BLA29_006115, partial [Euroglyphus maynei]
MTIRVKARGNPMPKLTWYHNDHRIRDRRFFIEKTFEEIGWTELTIFEIFNDDEGEIKCIAENKYGQTQTIGQASEQSIDDNVYAGLVPPDFKRKLLNQIVKLGEKDFVYEVEFIGNPKPIIFWYHNGKIIDGDDHREYYTIITEGYNSKLIIHKMNEEDMGEYRARIFSFLGEAISIAEIKFQEQEQDEIEFKQEKIIKKIIKITKRKSKEDIQQQQPIDENKVKQGERQTLTTTTIPEPIIINDDDYDSSIPDDHVSNDNEILMKNVDNNIVVSRLSNDDDDDHKKVSNDMKMKKSILKKPKNDETSSIQQQLPSSCEENDEEELIQYD